MNYPSTYNEFQSVQLLIKGDAIAFENIYWHYSSRLMGALIKLVRSETIASEILQDVFIRLWNGRKQVDPNKSLRSYLFRIAENLAYDYFRKTARDKRLSAELISLACPDYNHVEEALQQKEKIELVESILANLPSQRRKVFRLVKLEEKTYVEVSEMLNISTSTVNDHIVKATKFIREQIHRETMVAVSSIFLLLTL